MSLRHKIIFFCSITSILILSIGLIGVLNVKKTFSSVVSLTFKDLPSISENSKMIGIAKDMRATVFRLNFKNASEGDIDKVTVRFNDLFEQYQSSRSEYRSLPFSSKMEEDLYNEIDQKFLHWKSISDQMIDIKKKDFNDSMFEDVLKSEYREAANDYLKSSAEFLDYLSAKTKEKISTIEIEYNFIFKLMMGILTFGLISSIIGSLILLKSTRVQLESLYETFQHKYKNLIEGCFENEKIANENLGRVDKQATALLESSAASQETCRTVEGIAHQAERLNRDNSENKTFLGSSVDSLAKLNGVISEVEILNQKLNDRVAKSSLELKNMEQILNDIEMKTSLINEIVFQTKLLSFNASVEAARAGEHGKGFTVVASEIGELASKSGSSSKEIFDIISNSRTIIKELIAGQEKETNEIVTELQKTVKNTVQLSNETLEKINTMINSMNKTSMIIDEISSSTSQQAVAMKEISDGILSLQNVNEDNESGANESVKRIVEIKNLAIEMDNSLKKLVFG